MRRTDGTEAAAGPMPRTSPAPVLLAVLPLLVASLAAGVAPDAASAQTVEGRLLESGTRRPISAGLLKLTDLAGRAVRFARSDGEGRFALSPPEAGSFWVVAHAPGYHAAVDGILELGDDGWIRIEYYLRPDPMEVEGLLASVEGRPSAEGSMLHYQGFYQRQAEGFGTYIDPDEIDRRRPRTTGSLLRGVPGLSIAYGGLTGQEVVCSEGPRRRPPTIFLDGVEVQGSRDGRTGRGMNDLDRFIGVEHIAAVEVYTGASRIPIRFNGTNGPCVIVIWTRTYESETRHEVGPGEDDGSSTEEGAARREPATRPNEVPR